MRRILAAGAAALLLAAWGTALAQAFPTKPITLICPWPPGGPTDLHLRKVAELAAKHLGQPVIIELGIDTVSSSPYGLVGPKGVPQPVVQLDQLYLYKSSEDYATWAAEMLKAERATIERVGLLAR